jgi:general secretion pathway protein O
MLLKWLNFVNSINILLVMGTDMFFFDWPLYESLGPVFFGIFVFIGALFGSFFNVLSLRWGDHQIAVNDEQGKLWMQLRGGDCQLKTHRAKSLMGGRSSCPFCKKPIPLYFNIPVFSWIVLLGKSACCEQSISIRYLAFELAGAANFAVVGYFCSPSVYALVLGLTLMVGLLIAVIDLQDGFIPDGLLLSLFGLTLLLTTAQEHWISSASSIIWLIYVSLSVLVLFGLMSKLAGRGVMGGADQYLLAISAAFQGPIFLYTIPVVFAGLILSAWAVKSGVVKRGFFTELIDAQKSVPAAPAIYLSMLAGAAIAISKVSL